MVKKLNHRQFRELIKIYYDQIDENGKKIPLSVSGTYGVGKSAAVKDTAEEIAKGRNKEFIEWNKITRAQKDEIFAFPEKYFVFIDIRLSENDTSDIKGLPNFKDDYSVEWKIPFWARILENPDSDGILFFDEINLATPLVISSTYKIIHDRVINESKINDNWLIIACGNRDDDRAYTHELAAPLKDRMGEVELTAPSIKEWTEWAIANNIDHEIIAYLNWKPSSLHVVDYESGQKCIKRGSKILLFDGSEKKIEDIKPGEEIVGYCGKFIKSRVTNTFKKEIVEQYTIISQDRELTCSGEHKFLTPFGYVMAKNLDKTPTFLNKINPPIVYGAVNLESKENKISKNEFLQNVKKENGKKIESISQCNIQPDVFFGAKEMEYFTRNIQTPETDGISLFGRFMGWGRQYLLLNTKEKSKYLLRAHNEDRDLFAFIQGLVRAYGILCEKRRKKESQVANEISNNDIWFKDSTFTSIVASIYETEKTSSLLDDRLDKSANKTNNRKGIQRNSSNEINSRTNEEIECKGERTEGKNVSIRKTNHREIFYDLETTTNNYLAEGFITHNSTTERGWARLNALKAGITDLRQLEIVCSSAIGEGIAKEFVGFIKLKELVNLDEIIDKPINFKSVTDVGVRYFIISSVAERYKEGKVMFEKVFEIATMLDKLGNQEFVALLWKLCSKWDKVRFRKDWLSKELNNPLREKFYNYLKS